MANGGVDADIQARISAGNSPTPLVIGGITAKLPAGNSTTNAAAAGASKISPWLVQMPIPMLPLQWSTAKVWRR